MESFSYVCVCENSLTRVRTNKNETKKKEGNNKCSRQDAQQTKKNK
jgi:hypothetical protein